MFLPASAGSHAGSGALALAGALLFVIVVFSEDDPTTPPPSGFLCSQAALMPDLSAAKRMVVDREIFCLLEQGLAPNLMSFVAELLGPEGLRRASPTMTASGQVGTVLPSYRHILRFGGGGSFSLSVGFGG